jgi:predicted Ser/Thr protein kinase
MLPPCAQCGAPVSPGGPGPGPGAGKNPGALLDGPRFCGSCGAALTTPAATARVQLAVDAETLRHFVAGSRCLLRLRLRSEDPRALGPVSLFCEVLGGGRLEPVRATALAPGESLTLPLWLVPSLPGFFELRGVILLTLADSGARSYLRFEGVAFRVGAAGDAPRVSVVNIDQSSARVVDNSRSQFALPADDRGGLVGEGDFRAVSLRPLDAAEAGELVPELAPASPIAADSPVRAPSVRTGASVRFTVKTELAQYEVSSVLAQGELATIYEGRRMSDGARVVVKIADDSADNDLMQAEVSALRLLRSEPSRQAKHLPTVLDQLHTRDGRLGTVLEFLDGIDLFKVRERLPQGLPPQHLIWLMRRCLSVLGWAHSRGVLHGNIDPAHIIVRAQDHNVWLIDWCYSIVNPARTGQGFRCLNEEYSPPEVAARKPPLPSSDLYSLGKCMFFALGGDPRTKTFPANSAEPARASSARWGESHSAVASEGGREAPPVIDERLQRFLQFCVMESPIQRVQDAWDSYRFLDRLRQEIWGPHRFIELIL